MKKTKPSYQLQDSMCTGIHVYMYLHIYLHIYEHAHTKKMRGLHNIKLSHDSSFYARNMKPVHPPESNVFHIHSAVIEDTNCQGEKGLLVLIWHC